MNKRKIIGLAVAGAVLNLVLMSGAQSSVWIFPHEVGKPPVGPKVLEAYNPDAPEIIVDRPKQLDGEIASPVKVLVRFVPKNGAKIVRDSIKVLYVTIFTNIDITDRIGDKITATGIRDDNADLPSGSHRLIVQLQDDQGVEGKKEFAVNVK